MALLTRPEAEALLAELEALALPSYAPALRRLRDGLRADLGRIRGTAARFMNTGAVAEGP
jgi:hypothetical protein